ncbi:uncharacterized protein N7483_011210 [Penicillium malachiteum]|uniref:uncharacterized protein n=1 Tax=Penicillium malachiteum TaxID=1324776 RepID=UPI002547702E|nr:uncharacterized protein N7483_011210 [Penicillium malachiteum]KAJ5714029.1 hypothetical protein N7483_011210 [Penicillium malachiteum]
MYSNRKRRTSDQHVPGTDYFLRAVGLLQDLYENPSVEQVEVMILFSFYANALGRVKSSYTYSGIALRIALGLGLHRTLPTDNLLTPIEREHRKRLWWTLYTLDRLCSSNLGFPVLASDSVIDVKLPTNEGLDGAELEEFSDPAHLIANVKLAKITGQICKSFGYLNFITAGTDLDYERKRLSYNESIESYSVFANGTKSCRKLYA